MIGDEPPLLYHPETADINIAVIVVFHLKIIIVLISPSSLCAFLLTVTFPLR